tara:strand:- start:615 stop:1082 length:468 start_codon:yes stop_codon:yes gene_type:complete
METPYKFTRLWTPDEWEDMNEDYEYGADIALSAHSLWTDTQVKIRAKTDLEKKRREAKEQIDAPPTTKEVRTSYTTVEDVDWFWVHLANTLRGLHITVSPIDGEKYYAADTDGQVCLVKKQKSDSRHPAIAANETARKIVLFFAEQKISKVTNEK